MKTSEVAALLSMAAAFDNRTVGEANVAAWASVLLEDMRFEDGVDALKDHFASSTEYLKPAHINAKVREVQKERVRQSPWYAELEPAGDDLDGAHRNDWRKAYYKAIRNGVADPKSAADMADRELNVIRTPLPPADLERLNKILGQAFHPMRMELS